MRLPTLLFASLLLTACGDLRDAYGKEYVLYDSRNAERPAGTEPETASDGPQAPATTRDTDEVASDLPAEFRRILVLERIRGELERAILDDLDREGRLAEKRRAVEDELRKRLAAHASEMPAWRAARARELAAFAVDS